VLRKIARAMVIAAALSTSAGMAVVSDGQEDICASSAVIVCDNFEARATGSGDLTRAIYKNRGWALSELSTLTVASDDKFSGTKSLKLSYPSSADGAGFMDTSFSPQSTIYARWYAKWSDNWMWSDIATKHAALMTTRGSRAPYMFHSMWNSPELLHAMESADGTFYYPNQTAKVSFVGGRWYCLEIRMTMNAPGQANGVLESWVDGTRHWYSPNVVVDNLGPSYSTLMISGYWNNSGKVHPAMARWHDNFVLSTQRIGCIGPGSTVPARPTGLRIIGHATHRVERLWEPTGGELQASVVRSERNPEPQLQHAR
jgi:hypothetical protein